MRAFASDEFLGNCQKSMHRLAARGLPLGTTAGKCLCVVAKCSFGFWEVWWIGGVEKLNLGLVVYYFAGGGSVKRYV